MGKLREAAYLIHLDIRPVALVASSHREFTPDKIRELQHGAGTYDDVIFKVVRFSDGRHFALYSKYQWAIDLYEIAAGMPHDYEHALRGLLHGIPACKVQEFLTRCESGVADG